MIKLKLHMNITVIVQVLYHAIHFKNIQLNL